MEKSILLRCATNDVDEYLPPMHMRPKATDVCDIVDMMTAAHSTLSAEGRSFFGIVDGLTCGIAIGYQIALQEQREKERTAKAAYDKDFKSDYVKHKGYRKDPD